MEENLARAGIDSMAKIGIVGAGSMEVGSIVEVRPTGVESIAASSARAGSEIVEGLASMRLMGKAMIGPPTCPPLGSSSASRRSTFIFE